MEEMLTYRRPNMPLEAEIVRELTVEDLETRARLGAGSTVPSLKSLRATHHRLAHLIATGVPEAEASAATGYSISRISILKTDPAFKELLAFYAERRESAYVDVEQRMAGVAVDTLEVLHEKVLETGHTMSVKDLNAIIKTTADRGGFSPVRKTENKTIVIDANDLMKMKEEVEAKQNGQIRKINQGEEAQRVRAFIEQSAQEDTKPEVCSNDNRPAEDASAEAQAEGEPGEGDNL